MSLEENRAVVQRFFAALDDQDLDGVAALLAPDYRLHFDGNPEMGHEAGSVSSAPSSPRSRTSPTSCRTKSPKKIEWPRESS